MEEEVKENKSKKKHKIDYANLGIEDFEMPPHFPDVDPAPWKCMVRPLVTRAEWGADPPRSFTSLQLPVKRVLFTYTGTEECTTKEQCTEIVRRLQLWHMKERGLPDIQYNFLAGGDLNVFEGRGWNAKPEKNEKFPELSKESIIEIAYIGNFKEKTPPTEMQEHAWNMLEDSISEDKLDVKAGITEDYYDPNNKELLDQYLRETYGPESTL